MCGYYVDNQKKHETTWTKDATEYMKNYDDRS
jgi:hypothetical protein